MTEGKDTNPNHLSDHEWNQYQRVGVRSSAPQYAAAVPPQVAPSAALSPD